MPEPKNKTLVVLPTMDWENKKSFAASLKDVLSMQDVDVLVIDDSGDNDTEQFVNGIEGIGVIRPEYSVEFGVAFVIGCTYARDLGYEITVFLDVDAGNCKKDAEQMLREMDYGYDIVSCSRILENKDAANFSKERIDAVQSISYALSETAGIDLTDPLSETLCLRTELFDKLSLDDDTHGIFMQLWIQAAYFNLTTIEIPCVSGKNFGSEFELYGDIADEMISVMEVETYLYPLEKGK